ncbi:MAG: hypothetical protein OEV85_07255 [Candidatus Thorarchaeota archaeon]|nr:hypothetical protein [Candidatus Thorarchaeota archaeon]
MTDREKMLELLDEFKNSIVKMIDERDSLASESEELRAGRREAEEKSWAAEEKVKALTNDLERAKKGQTTAEAKLDKLQEELATLKAQLQEAESSKTGEIDNIRRERDEFKKELDEISEQLNRVSELYREASAEKEALAEKVDVSDLLAIYITLIETAFYGKPHARILYMLHDVKSAVTRKNIASSSGIMPAVVRKAVYDLANADLVKVNEESDEVTLTKDILRRG